MSQLFTGSAKADDDDEPDLAKYAAIDLSALQDIRQVGARYCLSLEATLQSIPGLTAGYLPEKDARDMLVGVSTLLININ